jgi:hypothetical protein
MSGVDSTTKSNDDEDEDDVWRFFESVLINETLSLLSLWLWSSYGSYMAWTSQQHTVMSHTTHGFFCNIGGSLGKFSCLIYAIFLYCKLLLNIVIYIQLYISRLKSYLPRFFFYWLTLVRIETLLQKTYFTVHLNEVSFFYQSSMDYETTQ